MQEDLVRLVKSSHKETEGRMREKGRGRVVVFLSGLAAVPLSPSPYMWRVDPCSDKSDCLSSMFL